MSSVDVGLGARGRRHLTFATPCQAEDVSKKARGSCRLHAQYAQSFINEPLARSERNIIVSVDQPPQPARIAVASCPTNSKTRLL